MGDLWRVDSADYMTVTNPQTLWIARSHGETFL